MLHTLTFCTIANSILSDTPGASSARNYLLQIVNGEIIMATLLLALLYVRTFFPVAFNETNLCSVRHSFM